MPQGVDLLADGEILTMKKSGKKNDHRTGLGTPRSNKRWGICCQVNWLKGYKTITSDVIGMLPTHKWRSWDGNTNESALALLIAMEGFELSKGANPVEIRKGVMLRVDTVSVELKKQPKPVINPGETAPFATISTNGDRDQQQNFCCNHRGSKGVLTIEDRKTLNAELGIEGTRTKITYLLPWLIHQKLRSGDSRILVASSVQSIMFTLETANAQWVFGCNYWKCSPYTHLKQDESWLRGYNSPSSMLGWPSMPCRNAFSTHCPLLDQARVWHTGSSHQN